MTLWRLFWNYPPTAAVVPAAPGTGNGNIETLITRAAILLHELFHFTFIIPFSTGKSNDPRYAERYSVQDYLDLVINDPAVAAINPQSLIFTL
ncbi:hypothetical protein OEA41_009788 [Lepraria neglecta]|uniref:Uncharacterized protein n=1 Tax=Lepraria neglecta TaxID=209136 RepID=A0AAE0DH51_9LECA|nr:hypothetical protein OEA41_009788 [Lepraria neglecta]